MGTTIQVLVPWADIIFVAVTIISARITPKVPTPFNKRLGHLDTSLLQTVISEIAAASSGLESKRRVIVRSTVPVGTTDALQAQHHDVLHIGFMPEFLTEDNWKRDVDSTDQWPVGFSQDDDGAFCDILSKMLRPNQSVQRLGSAR